MKFIKLTQVNLRDGVFKEFPCFICKDKITGITKEFLSDRDNNEEEFTAVITDREVYFIVKEPVAEVLRLIKEEENL